MSRAPAARTYRRRMQPERAPGFDAPPRALPERGTFVARPPSRRGEADRAGAADPVAGTRGEGEVRRGIRGGYPDEFGPLAALVADPLVTDIFVNGSDGVWTDRGHGLERSTVAVAGADEARDLAVQLLALGGRHIDEASPCVDARLHGGIRVHAVLPPISPTGALLSIRLPRVERLSLDALDAEGTLGSHRAVLDAFVARRENLLITGAGGSGKTTLLAALLASAPPTERIVAIEDVAELGVDHPHFVSLEARQANIEGAGEIGLARLVREALRMRPDRLVLGECRGEEVRELLSALNTGHDGGAGTLHANSLADVPARLEALGAVAGLGAEAIARQAVSAIGAVLHLERVGGTRRLAAIGRLRIGADGKLAIEVEAE